MSVFIFYCGEHFIMAKNWLADILFDGFVVLFILAHIIEILCIKFKNLLRQNTHITLLHTSDLVVEWNKVSRRHEDNNI